MKITPAPVIGLLHRAIYSTLATQSVKFSGYPYATVIPNVVDAHQQPILLISLLAEHTKNLLADHRISLSITDPGIGNIQEGARLTMVGDAESKELGDFGNGPEGEAAVAVETGDGVVVVADTDVLSTGVVGFPNQSVLTPRAASTAKATEARMPVKVFGKDFEARERGRGGMSAVQGGKRTAL